MGIFLTQVAIIVSNVYSYLFYFLYSVTLGCLIQEGGRLLSFRFFTTYSTLLRPPRLLILSKDVRSPVLFLCIKYRREYISRALPILAVVWKDVIALYSCFEVMVRKDTIVLHLYFENSFYNWANFVNNIKHIFCLLLHLLFQ